MRVGTAMKGGIRLVRLYRFRMKGHLDISISYFMCYQRQWSITDHQITVLRLYLSPDSANNDVVL